MVITKRIRQPILNALVIIMIYALCAAGCSKKVEAPPPPTVINANIVAADGLNPDDSGRPSPIILRVYELKSLGAFEAADFFSLFEDDTTQLGADLTHREEYQLRPGEQKIYRREPPPETQYLAVMAGYRQLNQAVWKASILIPPEQTSQLTITLDALAVSIKSE